MIGIYKITNPKGAIYIGSSKEIERRFKRYKSLKCKSQPKLYNSFVKYGVENHIFEIIEECQIEYLFQKENYYGLNYNCLDKNKGLNCHLPDITDVKVIISEESKINRSNAQLGKKATLHSKIKMSISQKGRKHTKETLELMSKSNKNSKIVLNLSTGIFYPNTKEAAYSCNMNRSTLKNMLNGSKKNKTTLIYV